MKELKVNVIIADDNKKFCNILYDYISKQKDIIVTGIANNGVETIKLIEEKKPNLVILDIIMPKFNGLGVLERLNTMDLVPFPQVIVISAVAQDKITQRALSLGADYYFEKPFDMEILVKRIRQMLNHTPSSDNVEIPLTYIDNAKINIIQ